MLGTPDPILADLNVWQDHTTEFSYGRFRMLAQRYLRRIIETERSLYLTSLPLCELNNILLPAQCREAITILKKVNKYTQDFCEQLSQSPRLSQMLLCDTLLFTLHSVEEQSSNLIILINSYCATDTNSFSSYTLLQRKHIAVSFKRLITLIAEVSLQTKQFAYEREMRNNSSQSIRTTEPLYDPAHSMDSESRLPQNEGIELSGEEVSEEEDEIPQVICLESYKTKFNDAGDRGEPQIFAESFGRQGGPRFQG